MNVDKFEAKRLGVSNIIPDRRFNKGAWPGVRVADSKSKNDTTNIKWVNKRTVFSEVDKRTILGAVLKIGVKAIFGNHVYKYCDKIYKQINGGLTGFQVTGWVAKL